MSTVYSIRKTAFHLVSAGHLTLSFTLGVVEIPVLKPVVFPIIATSSAFIAASRRASYLT